MAWQGTELTSPHTLLTRLQVLAEAWIFKDLILTVPDTDSAIRFCAERHLLANTNDCQRCNRPRRISKDAHAGKDGIIWRCYSCQSRKSIRSGSFFEKSHLSLDQIILFTYCWSKDWPLKDCAAESGGMAKHTQVDWANFLRDICQADLMTNPPQIGGWYDDANGVMQPEIVELDETLLSHAKYHRGRHVGTRWIFGGIQRSNGACFMVEVPNRTKETLEPIIQEYVRRGSYVMTDGWASYADIDQIDGGIYTHDVVIHERHFVNPDDPNVHTQNIENSWMHMKRKLKRQFGTSRALLSSYLAEFLWRRRYREHNYFSAIWACITEHYPL